MSYLTFNQLEDRDFSKAEPLNESLSFHKWSHKTVFISYRRKDKKYVVPIVNFLRRIGANVYIDYLDDSLPNPPDNSTAAILRKRIRSSDKFILMATPNSKESKWMPWELGLGDGFDGYENAVILPLVDRKNYWDEREYYRVYGHINKTEDKFPSQLNHWQITYPTGRKVDLKKWINA